MLEEFRGHVFVYWIGLREFQRHGKHGEAIKSHPRSAVRLLQKSTGRQQFRAVENADVIEPEKTAGEKIVAFGVFAVHPPGEIEQQLLECAFKKSGISSEPVANDVIVKLLAPKQSRVSLTRNLHRFFIDSGGRNRVVKFVRLFHALGKDLIEIGKGIAWHFTFR